MGKVRTILIYIFLAFLFVSLVRNLINYQNKLAFYNGYKNAYEAEKKRNVTLQTQLKEKDDFTQLEEIIRDKLNLLKPGEVAVIIPSPTPTPDLTLPTPAPNWMQWKNLYFKNLF